jgi:hypothetical protein
MLDNAGGARMEILKASGVVDDILMKQRGSASLFISPTLQQRMAVLIRIEISMPARPSSSILVLRP